MVTAIVSIMTGIPVRRDVAMTGEITLRGRVLPIGGSRKSCLQRCAAASRQVMIPEDNAKDLPEIPDNVKNGLEIIPVAKMGDVLPFAFKIPTGRAGLCRKGTP
jgi:ATP-dependent Lon protease